MQNAFRQNIMQMQETARHSLMSYTPGGGSPRGSTLYGRDGATAGAFDFKTPFPSPAGQPASPVLDECA